MREDCDKYTDHLLEMWVYPDYPARIIWLDWKAFTSLVRANLDAWMQDRSRLYIQRDHYPYAGALKYRYRIPLDELKSALGPHDMEIYNVLQVGCYICRRLADWGTMSYNENGVICGSCWEFEQRAKERTMDYDGLLGR